MHFIRTVMRRFGIESHRANAMTLAELRLPEFLAQHNISTVFDVGANDGGFGEQLFASSYRGKIYSFEPLPEAWLALNKKAANVSSRWFVFPPVALSDRNGEAEFHEADNSVSSSMMMIAPAHTVAAPHSTTRKSITVTTRKFDEYLPELGGVGNSYLKIDVQGAEKLVLAGAMKALQSVIVGVQVELSLTKLYDGQPISTEIDHFLKSLGFELWDILPGFRDPRSFRLLQYDGIYFRR